MHEVLTVVAFISDIFCILMLFLQLYVVLSDARKKAKPSAATDGFDTGSEAQAEGPAL